MDYTPNQKAGLPEDMKTRYRDMGDGTHARVVGVTSSMPHLFDMWRFWPLRLTAAET